MATSTHELTDRTVGAFQHRLHAALQSFLNGDFVIAGSRRGALLRPLRLASCRIPWDLFAGSLSVLRQNERAMSDLGARGRTLADRGEAQRWLWFDEAAHLLSALYGVLDRWLPPGDQEQPVQVLREYAPELYSGDHLRPIRDLAAYVRRDLHPFIAGFYLHGSLSTDDYTGFSDVDDFVVIRRETVTSGAALGACAAACIRASRYLYDFDVLQHHRHYVATEVDLRRYSTAFLPPEVLHYATALSTRGTLRLSLRRDDEIHRNALVNLARGVRTMAGTAPVSNAWRLKYLVAAVLLVPVLFLESRGTYCYKKFSFALARDAFAGTWQAVDMATEIRRRWRYRVGPWERLLRWLITRGLGNPVLFERIMQRVARPVPGDVRTLVTGRFPEAAAEFAQAALQLAAER